MTITLIDAGEKAGDVNRVMRAINSLVLMHSASAALTQTPTTELQILSIGGAVDRDVTVLGDREALHIVKSVVDSIPDAVADIHPEDDIDIHELVVSFPIFNELQSLESAETFSLPDIIDIEDKMYRGVLLALESGIVPNANKFGDMSSTQPSGKTDSISHLQNTIQTANNVDTLRIPHVENMQRLPHGGSLQNVVDIELQP